MPQSPSCLCPTHAPCLHSVQDHMSADQLTKPLVIHIFTDGHPTNQGGYEDMNGLVQWLRTRPNIARTFISICLCTDEEDIDRMYRQLE